MFFGRFQHSLDAKGRVILPSRFRVAFDTVAYLSQHVEGCLALWTPDVFAKQIDEMLEHQGRGRAERNVARYWAAGLVEVEMDRQGRVAIPSYLRTFAQLESEVLVVGALDRIELWHPPDWETQVGPSAADFRGAPQPEAGVPA
ncbi:MAG: division/cell wall cluster transcriptional repressor MraZ [Acidimicrobiales bacterium]